MLLPLLLAACAGGEPQSFPPLRYSDLPPIGLNVANISVEEHFVPSLVPPDVTQFDPAPPVDALRAMAEDRLKALGSAGRAVFIIKDASLVRHGDTISGTMDVLLNVYPSQTGPRAGFAEASVSRQYTGHISDLRATLYDMTKKMMQSMNVEFEYQVRHRLHDWLASGTAAVPPVQQQPLNATGTPTSPPSAAPASGQPTSAPSPAAQSMPTTAAPAHPVSAPAPTHAVKPNAPPSPFNGIELPPPLPPATSQ